MWVLAGTGSRTLQGADAATRAAVSARTTQLVARHAAEHGDMVVMSGMAEGFDDCLARAALRLGLPLWCAVPNRGYGAYYWGRRSLTGRDRLAEFRGILDRAWRVTHVMEDVHGRCGLYLNGVHSNFVRNVWMVEQAARFLVWDSGSPGTAQCLAALVAAGRPYDDV